MKLWFLIFGVAGLTENSSLNCSRREPSPPIYRLNCCLWLIPPYDLKRSFAEIKTRSQKDNLWNWLLCFDDGLRLKTANTGYPVLIPEF